jgi:hypothetical protein
MGIFSDIRESLLSLSLVLRCLFKSGQLCLFCLVGYHDMRNIMCTYV